MGRSVAGRRSAPVRTMPKRGASLLAVVLLTASLSACGSSEDAPGAVTAGEQKALDDAAEMVEGQKLDPASLPSAPAITTPPHGPATAPAK